MKVMIDNLVLCTDCTMAAVNDDFTGLDYHYTEEESNIRYEEITNGLKKLGSGLCYDSNREDDEFSRRQCDCCGTRQAGRRCPFIIVGRGEVTI